jgi:Ca-activated chloride channel homolog
MKRKFERNWTIVTLCVLLLAAVSVVADGAQIKLSVGMAKPLLLAGQKQTTHLKIALTGFEFRDKTKRVPVNLAIVIDKSGSMSGEKIRKAKEAALMALKRLNSKDTISVVAYDHNVRVLVPATKVAETAAIRSAINEMSAGGNTALFAGTSKGAAEARKFLDKNRANRVILISDGLANVGPSSPKQLGELGASLIKEGISVTTVGLGGGYNEDLMTQLARRSDGNHYFAENATDLARVFKGELGDVLSVCAQEVTIKIKCAPGIRPVRTLGRDADIAGQFVTARMNQLYSGQEKYVLLEVEVPATEKNKTLKIADVEVGYANMATQTSQKLTSDVKVRFTKDAGLVKTSINKPAMIAVVTQIGNYNNDRALVLRDQGKLKEARLVLQTNVMFFDAHIEFIPSDELKRQRDYNTMNLKKMDIGGDWNKLRKDMRAEQLRNAYQQLNK